MIDKFIFINFFGMVRLILWVYLFDKFVSDDPRLKEEEKKMRDTKVLESFKKITEKKLKEMNIFKNLKKEVEHGAKWNSRLCN